ncbi:MULTISPECIES: LysR substrate-binding domain-containing protein [Pseudomonas]|uniref:LysR substrate-binding domain-containing protein n=1 Tax=Pseudomonas TaxID=286 RepID=UPI00224ACA84|nr:MULTISPECIES: LysR substrate-binding domain-containing protein [unclassified Pseudomonas]MCX2891291.1 LysR substrate-binding domain-containing protein [Pseudomonas sp. DCB_BI]MDH4549420.1 LysR family transcriptional regulator [Pseudomonas sp. BN607]
MNNLPSLHDLKVFLLVARRFSFTAAADELGMSPAFVSKRIRALEQDLSLRLLHRSTRSVTLTDEGERVSRWAQQLLYQVSQLGDEIDALHGEPKGLLRVVSSPGLGRRMVAPALAELAARYPGLDIRLDVQDRLVDLVEEGVDLDIRVGNDLPPDVIAKPLAQNHRVLCASPHYLRVHGTPASLSDLGHHDCLVIKERDHPFGVWNLAGPRGPETVKVTGSLSTNNGEIARQWCLDGRGILLRSMWDIKDDLQSARLVQVLGDYWQAADIWAVHTSPLLNSAKVKVTVEFLSEYFRGRCS